MSEDKYFDKSGASTSSCSSPPSNSSTALHSVSPPPRATSATEAQNVTVVIGSLPQRKSLFEAYMLCLPLGVLGLHQFYLRRYGWGVLYFLTLGLAGIGWLVDIVRMPTLVKNANRKIDHPDEVEPLSLVDAYVLWFPFGFLGFHHFYLHRPAWGVAYLFTAGLFGLGWLIDAFRMPSMTREANERLEREHSERTPRTCSLSDAYALGISPAGIFGAHHFYMRNYQFGCFYMCTFGGAGIGWIYDWFRMPWLVDRANNPQQYPLGKRQKTVDDAYIMAFPFGVLGAHHFYLERPYWGLLYFFTLGLGGVGWLVDIIRMPWLVAETNQRLLEEMKMIDEIRTQLGSGQCTVRQANIAVYPPNNYNGISNMVPPMESTSDNDIQPPPYSEVAKVSDLYASSSGAAFASAPPLPAYDNEAFEKKNDLKY